MRVAPANDGRSRRAARLRQQFRAAGLDTPELDARVLVGHALGARSRGACGSSGTSARRDRSRADRRRCAARRLAGEPVARIVGEREFWGLPLIVTPAVLVPRPETETVVELALVA